MLQILRQKFVQKLWQQYCLSSPDINSVKAVLGQYGITQFILDHFAVIDLPGPHSGIPHLSQIFSALGFIARGKDYLAEKQNDFLWMGEENCLMQLAPSVLPQIVAADFRLDEMPLMIRNIIYYYSSQTKPPPLKQIQTLIQKITQGDENALDECMKVLLRYFQGRDWHLPTMNEFYSVREFNELLAWVLIFGRRVNHFGLSIHLLNQFHNLDTFHQLIKEKTLLELNQEGGEIKGGKHSGIAQGATRGVLQSIELIDGTINIPTGFIEFVWRYKRDEVIPESALWNDYFTGFVGQHADHVIESLYCLNNKLTA